MLAKTADPPPPAHLIVPIYASLPQHRQMAVFQPPPPGTRKVLDLTLAGVLI